MAVDSYDPTTGRPIFLDSGAPDVAVDPTAVGIYAAEVGNRIVKANLAALDAYTHKRAGLMGHALDTKTDYIHNGAGWAKVWVTAGGVVSTGTDGSGYVVVTHGMGKTPASVQVEIAADSPVIPHRLTSGVDAIGATTFRVTIWRRDNDTVLAANPVKFYWTAVA